MKIYEYFLKSNNEEHVYAFTNNKEIAKQFESIRNMKLFHKEIEHMDKDEYMDFANDNLLHLISIHDLNTTGIIDGEIAHVKTKLAMTDIEYETSTDPGADPFEDFWYGKENIYMLSGCFKNKYRTLLDHWEYYTMGKVYLGRPVDEEHDDYNAPDFLIDELGAFYLNYEKYLK